MKRRQMLRTLGAAGAATAVGRPRELVAEAEPRAESASERGSAPSQTKTSWPVRGTEAFEIESKEVGDTMAVGVWQPDPQFLAMRGLTPADKLDVLYVLDGSWALGMAAAVSMLQLADLVRPGFPPLLLVGVDYPEGRPNARSRDYTMRDAVPKSMAPALAANPATAPGGADKFLAFLENELDPMIRSRYRAKPGPAGILGDSFGGTFTFYAFLKQSRLFDKYWLGSPGLFSTDTDWVGQVEAVVAGSLVHDTRMFLSLGDLEATGGVEFYEDMGRNFGRLVDTLERRRNPRLTHRSKRYPGHTHTSVLAPALNDALLYLYGKHFPG
ncbi:MAG: alpha/beta hydrolase [Gemmatimonadales bacterium]|nr:alpha/beta hydrolase [Gemmatimonadales bacterium]